MILIDNVNYLKIYFPRVLEILRNFEDQKSSNEFHVATTRSGDSTLYREYEENHIYVHSRYNPVAEATSIMQKYEDVEAYDHVLFYGLGLGYHIAQFVKQFPEKSFSIYEPSVGAFYRCVEHKLLEQFSPNNLKVLYIEKNADDVALFLQHFVTLSTEKTLFIPLPSYERLFTEQLERFSSGMSKSIGDRITHLHTNLGFEKRWTINSLKNFLRTMECRNIFQHNPGFLKDKPVLLVAAGPSLQYEVDNIKLIKEKGLAYIVTVGSGIKALLSYGIYPDFACTYDPLVYNQYVFDEVVSENIETIPLIYGTSVGFETLQIYPGPMYHMVTSQDTVGSYYLENQPSAIDKVQDAASIAIVTLQLLSKLGAKPIVLAGQNFAYNDGQFYATGVKMRSRDEKLRKTEQDASFLVDSVEEGQVYSNAGLTRMKSQMEDYISINSSLEYINTTRAGAKIKGTTYVTLDELLATRLNKKVVEENTFTDNKPMYDNGLILQKVEEMDKHFAQIDDLFKQLKQLLASMNGACQRNKRAQLQKHFPKWDKAIRRLRRNHFYNVFIQPMNRVSFELLSVNIDRIKFQEDLITKGNLIVDKFGKYINECWEVLELFRPIYKEEYELIVSKLEVGKEQKVGL